MVKLTGPEHWAWLGLRRVNCGVVARFEGRYYDRGLAIPGWLYDYLFDTLIGQGLLDVADPDEYGMARITLSGAGHAEYRALCKQQRQRAGEVAR